MLIYPGSKLQNNPHVTLSCWTCVC